MSPMVELEPERIHIWPRVHNLCLLTNLHISRYICKCKVVFADANPFFASYRIQLVRSIVAAIELLGHGEFARMYISPLPLTISIFFPLFLFLTSHCDPFGDRISAVAGRGKKIASSAW